MVLGTPGGETMYSKGCMSTGEFASVRGFALRKGKTVDAPDKALFTLVNDFNISSLHEHKSQLEAI